MFCPLRSSSKHRVVRKIESSRRDGKSSRGDWCVSVGALWAFREASAFIRVDGEMRWLPAYIDNNVKLYMKYFIY